MTDKEKYIKALKREGYTDRNASLVADELTNISPELQPFRDMWANLSMLPPCYETPICGAPLNTTDYELNGYSILGLVHKRHMTYPAALLTMDWIIKEPEKALSSLKKGVR